MKLPFSLERSLVVAAQRSTVFRFFTDSERFAAWWGPGSHVDARPGGEVYIRYPNGAEARGEFVEILPSERLLFTYGYEKGEPIVPGGSRVTISLEDHEVGTRLRLRHEVADVAIRDAHIPGWRYQLALLANVAAQEQHSGFVAVVDRYFAAWAEADGGRRRAALEAVVAPHVEFRDAFGCTSGIEDLDGHVAAVQRQMPGVTLSRDGEPRLCQGTALVDWVARGADGSALGTGTNVIDLAPDGKVRRVVGLWRPPAAR